VDERARQLSLSLPFFSLALFIEIPELSLVVSPCEMSLLQIFAGLSTDLMSLWFFGACPVNARIV
jgi:hypothetical protein